MVCQWYYSRDLVLTRGSARGTLKGRPCVGPGGRGILVNTIGVGPQVHQKVKLGSLEPLRLAKLTKKLRKLR